MPEPVRFLASFPQVLAALKIGQDGMRIQLDIPESEMDQARRLLDMRGQVLVITVELEEDAIRHGTHPTAA
jgi:hypothetical protein